jgi:hypothetical protein
MSNPVKRLLGRQNDDTGTVAALERRVANLEDAVTENRRLNQRLADVVDVVTELLVPAMDRDDARVKAALDRLNGQPD